MNKLKNYVKDLPFALLFIDAIWWVLSFYGIYISDYWWVGEIFSHSITFTIVLSFYAYLHRYCLYSWVCIIGLGLLNALNIWAFFFTFTYYQIYSGIIVLTALTFAVIKWIQIYYFK